MSRVGPFPAAGHAVTICRVGPSLGWAHLHLEAGPMSIYRGPMSISSHPCPSAGWAHLGGLAHLHRWPISRSRVGPSLVSICRVSPCSSPGWAPMPTVVHLQGWAMSSSKGRPISICRMGPCPSLVLAHVHL